MNVFILNTGRCGSTTFIQACRHFTNYSAGHETRHPYLGDARFAYPPNHIEADNRLSWLLGRLDAAFGDEAVYVHLRRDIDQVAASFVKRYGRGIIKAYRGDGIISGLRAETDPLAVALDYCETVNRNIELFLKGKSRTMEFRIEAAQDDFPRFCELIGAEGDWDAALAEFDVRHNAS